MSNDILVIQNSNYGVIASQATSGAATDEEEDLLAFSSADQRAWE